MTEPIELHWTPRRRDFVEATLITTGRALVVVPILLVLCGAVLLVLDEVVLGVLLVGCGLAFPLPVTVGAALTYGRKPLARAERHAVVDDEGVHMTTTRGTSHIHWHTVTGWRERSRWFVLRLGGPRPRSTALLQKRALTPEARARLVALLEEHAGSDGAGRQAQPAP